MPRLFFIAVLFGVLTGCSSTYHFTGVVMDAVPIENTESYYVVVHENKQTEIANGSGKSIVRVESDGSVHPICHIDNSNHLEMQVAHETALVMKIRDERSYKLYSVLTGNLSPLPEGYKWSEGYWPEIKDKVFDSLLKETPLRGVNIFRVFSTYSPDHYLVEVIRKDGRSQQTGDSFEVGCFAGPQTYWSIADMKKKTITKVSDEGVPCYSSSRKNILFTYRADDGKEYTKIVHLKKYVK